MKRVTCLILSSILVLALFSCKDSDKEGKGQKEKQKTSFRKANWGMSRDEVKHTEDTVPVAENDQVVVYKAQFNDVLRRRVMYLKTVSLCKVSIFLKVVRKSR